MAHHSFDPEFPKARKEHRCDWCNGDVQISEYYCRLPAAVDGAMYKTKLHTDCYQAIWMCVDNESGRTWEILQSHGRRGLCSMPEDEENLEIT